jgi:hypothetical protein
VFPWYICRIQEENAPDKPMYDAATPSLIHFCDFVYGLFNEVVNRPASVYAESNGRLMYSPIEKYEAGNGSDLM